MQQNSIERISVIGIGRLGLSLALCMEEAGFSVVGMDIDAGYVSRLAQKELETHEPGIAQLLSKARNFFATTDLTLAIDHSDLVFVVVPTPSEPGGGYDHSRIHKVVEEVRQRGRQKETKHLVISSTTQPGFCDSVARELDPLNWTVTYNPEFVAQGNILHDQRNPDLLLIGEGSPVATELLASIYSRICRKSPIIHQMSRLSAEITKLAINCFLTTKIGFANLIGDLASRAGAEPDRVLHAIGSDGRIGPSCLNYGFGFGGPCLPRDNRALSSYARSLGLSIPISEATDQSNRLHLENQIAEFCRTNQPGAAVRLGPVCYKRGSMSIEESQQLAFAVRIAKLGFKVTICDHLPVLQAVRQIHGALFHGYEEV